MIIESLANSNDFEGWANNRLVIDMLSEAQRHLHNGHITEEELQKVVLGLIQKEVQVRFDSCHQPLRILSHGVHGHIVSLQAYIQ